MRTLLPGEKFPLAEQTVMPVDYSKGAYRVEVTWTGGAVDCFGLLVSNELKMLDEDGVVFYNSPSFELPRTSYGPVVQTESSANRATFSVPAAYIAAGNRFRLAVAADADNNTVQLDDVKDLTVIVTPPTAAEPAHFVARNWNEIGKPPISCGALADIYSRGDGKPSVAAVGQGWEGDISRLLQEHGVALNDVVEQAPSAPTPVRVTPPAPAPAPIPTPQPVSPVVLTKGERRKVNLEKIRTEIADPATRISMEKKYIAATSVLDQFNVPENKAKVALVLDVSGSTGPGMNNLYGDKTMQELAYRAMSLALEWDADGKVDVFTFSNRATFVGSLTLSEISDFLSNRVEREVGGGTSFIAPAKALNQHYFGRNAPSFEKGESVYALVGTDGDCFASEYSRGQKAWGEMSSKRLVAKFTKLGRGPFGFLDSLDEMNEGRARRGTYDNYDVMDLHGQNPKSVSDKDFVYQMVKEYLIPEQRAFGRAKAPWVEQASGLLIPTSGRDSGIGW